MVVLIPFPQGSPPPGCLFLLSPRKKISLFPVHGYRAVDCCSPFRHNPYNLIAFLCKISNSYSLHFLYGFCIINAYIVHDISELERASFFMFWRDAGKGIFMKFDSMLSPILSLLYPPVCPVCFKILNNREQMIHPACEKNLVWVKKPVCLKCGKPVYSPVQEYCMDCFKSVPPFDGGASVWVYTKAMADSIAMYKYQGKREFAVYYVKKAVEIYGDWICQRQPQCITAVPLNKRKARIRGFNQALMIAEGIGKALGIPVDDQLLVRSRFTEPQKGLNPQQRLKNLQQAFGPGDHAGKYKRVLLVDDIYTTGSTMRICSSLLKEQGVEHVWILSLCIGSDY